MQQTVELQFRLDLIKSFTSITHCSREKARDFLATSKWDLNTAITKYNRWRSRDPVGNAAQLFNKYKSKNLVEYDQCLSSTSSHDQSRIQQTKKQKEDGGTQPFIIVSPKTQIIQFVGFLQFLSDINVRQQDPVCGYLLFLMNATSIYEITFDQFSQLINMFSSPSLQVIRDQMYNVRKQYQKPEVFCQVYLNLFHLYNRNTKVVKLDHALCIWRIYLAGRIHFEDEFFEFFGSLKEDIREDVWKMIIDFEFSIRGNIRNYNSEDGWSSIIDRYVEFLQKSTKSTIQYQK